MKPIQIIKKYYKVNTKLYNLLVSHSRAVKNKSLEIAKKCPNLNPDLKFIGEAAMLHDIGIFLTNAPEIDCFGDKSYICHGYLGGEILKKEGFPRHALVCERHTGMGISIKDIERNNLPLPKRNMSPVSVEEKIICLADKFFSKNEEFLTKEKTINQIIESHLKFGEEKIITLNKWLKDFGL
ncbi:MAG: HDIG domain-containing metalloprotein [Patescibacteria group bacterium]|jgi:uncharacterized protein